MFSNKVVIYHNVTTVAATSSRPASRIRASVTRERASFLYCIMFMLCCDCDIKLVETACLDVKSLYQWFHLTMKREVDTTGKQAEAK